MMRFYVCLFPLKREFIYQLIIYHIAELASPAATINPRPQDYRHQMFLQAAKMGLVVLWLSC